MAFENLSYTSLLDELESDQVDFDLPAWSTKESPGHESVTSVDSGTGGSVVFADTSPSLNLFNDPNLNDAQFSSILEELESVDLTVMQKPMVHLAKKQKVAKGPVPSLEMEKDAFVTDLLDIAFDVPRLRRDACSSRGKSIESASSNDQSEEESDDQGDSVSVCSSASNDTSFIDKLDLSKAKVYRVVTKPNGGARNIQTIDMNKLRGKTAIGSSKHTSQARSQRMTSLIKDVVKSDMKETVDDMENAELDSRNKSALNARIQRQRKKKYISSIENENESLKEENAEMKKKLSSWEKEKSSYEEEIEYLKSVLANQSTLSSLLKNIEGVDSVKLSTSFSRKRRAAMDHEYTSSSGKKGKKSHAGVCLHVADKNKVSLEFCSKCAENAP